MYFSPGHKSRRPLTTGFNLPSSWVHEILTWQCVMIPVLILHNSPASLDQGLGAYRANWAQPPPWTAMHFPPAVAAMSSPCTLVYTEFLSKMRALPHLQYCPSLVSSLNDGTHSLYPQVTLSVPPLEDVSTSLHWITVIATIPRPCILYSLLPTHLASSSLQLVQTQHKQGHGSDPTYQSTLWSGPLASPWH